MNKQFFSNRLFFGFALLLTSTISVFAQAQAAANPVQEKLLNGLKVLTWRNPQADKVTIKLRIHSGSAFDPQGKEGLMNLLAENIFPNQAARDFFVEDMGGTFELIKNHDYIQLNVSGNSDEFLTILQTLAGAFSNMTIDKETTAKLKNAQIERLKQLEKNPAYIADQAIANRLLGSFPYGRSKEGTLESVQKIDFADLIFAKDRFFNADNATIAIIGNIKSDFAFRATKRYFGGWQKSENRVPSSFKQPDEPITKPLEIKLNGDENLIEIRFAMRGWARNDKDYAASEILANILQNRLQNHLAKNMPTNVFARHEEHILPGLMILGYSVKKDSMNQESVSMPPIFAQTISNDEFSKAKTEVSENYKTKAQADIWFDIDTFKIPSSSDEAKNFETVSIGDVQKAAEKLSKQAVVSIFLSQKTNENPN